MILKTKGSIKMIVTSLGKIHKTLNMLLPILVTIIILHIYILFQMYNVSQMFMSKENIVLFILGCEIGIASTLFFLNFIIVKKIILLLGEWLCNEEKKNE